jgi:hypothetical protein
MAALRVGSYVLNNGYVIFNYPKDENHHILPEAQQTIDGIVKDMTKIRNDTITMCVDFEYYLSLGISRFFFEDNVVKAPIFHDLILDTTILSLSQKKNLVKQLIDKYPDAFDAFPDEDSKKKFYDYLNFLIKVRNAFAHGKILIDYATRTSYVRYYDSNRQQKDTIVLEHSDSENSDDIAVPITPDFATELNEKRDYVLQKLQKGIAYRASSFLSYRRKKDPNPDNPEIVYAMQFTYQPNL